MAKSRRKQFDVCKYCRARIEAGNFLRCKTCGKTFCSECFLKRRGPAEFRDMLIESMDIQCPDHKKKVRPIVTNGDKCKAMGIYEDGEALLAAAGDRLCEICNEQIEKNLSPENPACEGRWCEEALELWLEEEADDVSDVG